MPRNVRNFWINAVIDGRRSPLVGGPRAKDGGFDLEIKQRHAGQVVPALTVLGQEIDGELHLLVRNGKGKLVHCSKTPR